MKLEELVTSLETSKKINEAGVEIDTPFCWASFTPIDDDEIWGLEHVLTMNIPDSDPRYTRKYRAYTFQQIWDVLPEWFGDRMDFYFVMPRLLDGYMGIYDIGGQGAYEDIEFKGDNLSDTAAQALLWCLENKYITLEEINK